jgi:hypothetical protein
MGLPARPLRELGSLVLSDTPGRCAKRASGPLKELRGNISSHSGAHSRSVMLRMSQ